MATQFAFGKIVTDGLVLALDAADKNSYPGSGTTWSDMSGNNNNGTLTNGPTFSSANGGSVVFDGVDDSVICTNNSSVQITTGTIIAWINANSNNTGFRGIITKQNAWGLFLFENLLVAYDWGNSQIRSTGINLGNNAWNYVAMSFTETIGTPSNNAIIYIRGRELENQNYQLTTTVKHVAQNITVQIGDGNSSQFFSGKIPIAQVYNRALSTSEILQNYNAQKSRFNL
jgi:hypothetical protein